MQTDSSVVMSILVMTGAIAAIVYDVAMRRRTERAAASRPPLERPAPARPLDFGVATAVTPLWLAGRPATAAPAVVSRAPEAAPEGTDPVRDLFVRLDAFRMLALDHVRVAHPLFQPDVVAADDAPAARSTVAWPTTLDAPAVPASTLPGPRRRRHLGVVSARGTAVLRLVVDRA